MSSLPTPPAGTWWDITGTPQGPWTWVSETFFEHDANGFAVSVDYLAVASDLAAERLAAARTLVPELLDAVEDLDAVLFQIEEARIDYEAALRNREHGAVAVNRNLDRNWCPSIACNGLSQLVKSVEHQHPGSPE